MQKRKRVSTSPCRVVKRARSVDRSEMRPFIKEIETLKAENYQLEQKLEKSQKSENPSKIPENSVQLENLREQVSEFQIQVHHQTAEIHQLQVQRDAAVDQLTAANQEIANQALTNQTLENQLVHVTQNAAAVEFAKNMLSDSLQAMINDYQNLSKEYAEKTAHYLRETTVLKEEMVKLEKGCKEGAIKIAQTAKVELMKIHEENFGLKRLLDNALEAKEPASTPVVKCSICLGVKKLANFSITDPCGHMHCKGCTEKLKKSKKNENCPSCRGPVSSMVKIFA
mgnify:CR=1 FL=1